jgi:hypothetical protein
MGRGDLARLGPAILASVLLIGGAGIAPRAARAQDARDRAGDGKGQPPDSKGGPPPDAKGSPPPDAKGSPPPDAKGSPPPDKKDDHPPATDEAAKIAIERFERDFASKEEGRKLTAISNLGATRNDLVTKKLGTLLGQQDSQVRRAAAQTLDGQLQNRALSGELLRKAVAREEDTEVVLAIVVSLGKIQYAKAVPEMGDVALKSRDLAVNLEVIRSFVKMKDARALLPVLDLWLANPVALPQDPGGEPRLDPGTPGDLDAKKAEDLFRLVFGDLPRMGSPPPTLRSYVQVLADAAEKMAGEKLSSPTDLMLWLVKHEADLGFRLPARVKQVLKEFQDRAAKAR